MNELELFFADNVEISSEIPYVVSDRFKDKDGKPIEWKLRPVSADRNNELKKMSTKKVPVVGNKNAYKQEFDANKYSILLTTESVVYPDLTNAALQDSWSKKTGEKIFDPERLLGVMLLSGEFDLLTAKVSEINGYGEDINEEVDEAKN